MTEVVNRIEKEKGEKVQPIFISCDPARDTSDALEKYLAGLSVVCVLFQNPIRI